MKIKRPFALLLAVVMVAAFAATANAAHGWEEEEGITIKFDDATALWELGTWMGFGGSEIRVGDNNGMVVYSELEVSGDVEVLWGTLELQDGTMYQAEYVLTENGNICLRLPIHLVPPGVPYRTEFRFVITRGDTGAVLWRRQHTYDGVVHIGGEMTIDASATRESPNEPSGTDYMALVVTPGPIPPRDEPSSWATREVEWAMDNDLLPYKLRWKYQQPITRAEFCALGVALYEKLKGETGFGSGSSFTDTNDENVAKMAALGVVTGVGGGRFAPDGLLTREQAATMLARLAEALGLTLTDGAPTFADNAQISSWAVDAVGQIQELGIMGGVGENSFAPKGQYTREQSISTILRLYYRHNRPY